MDRVDHIILCKSDCDSLTLSLSALNRDVIRAGRDAARAFATGCFATHRTHDIRGLTEKQMKVKSHSSLQWREGSRLCAHRVCNTGKSSLRTTRNILKSVEWHTNPLRMTFRYRNPARHPNRTKKPRQCKMCKMQSLRSVRVRSTRSFDIIHVTILRLYNRMCNIGAVYCKVFKRVDSTVARRPVLDLVSKLLFRIFDRGIFDSDTYSCLRQEIVCDYKISSPALAGHSQQDRVE